MIFSDKTIIRYKHGVSSRIKDPVICENWFNLFLNDKLIYQTPVLDQEIDDLISGLLYVKGHIKEKIKIDYVQKERSFYVSSNIALPGQSFRQMVVEAQQKAGLRRTEFCISESSTYKADKILDLMRDFQNLPSVYHNTGGVHMAAFAVDKILFWADDVSRRNSVDKVIGKILKSDINFEDGIFVSSGRISSDIVIRMIKIGVKLIASVSAPMDKAIDLANTYGITLCGFVRGRRMNIYTHPGRVITV